jgi:hypothetical protein
MIPPKLEDLTTAQDLNGYAYPVELPVCAGFLLQLDLCRLALGIALGLQPISRLARISRAG